MKPSTGRLDIRALVVKRRNQISKYLIWALLVFLLVGSHGCDATDEVARVAELPPPPPESPIFDSASAACLDQHFDSLIRANAFNGVALFASNGAIHTIKNGYRNLKTKDTLRATDQFQLASLSKPMTAFAVLQLIDQGIVALDAPITTYLPDMPYTEVTIRQLLSHTSGIGYYAYVTDGLWPDPELYMVNADLQTMLECGEVPDYYRPGQQFDYCNTNYTLLADVVEAVTGMSFQAYMQLHVFNPIGMFDTEILTVHQRDPLEYEVLGHYPNGTTKRPLYLDGVVGDKGVYSNVFDLYKFFEEWNTGNMISDSLKVLATTPQAKTGREQHYGLGWRIRTLKSGEQIIYHNGWWRGFRSYFWMSTDGSKCAIALTNVIRGGYLDQERIWNCY